MRALEYPKEVRGLLSFDFDGTLHLPERERVVEREFFDLLRELREDGWLWAINTGRSLLYMLEGFEECACPFAPDFLVAREREIYTPGDKFGRWHRLEDWHVQYQQDMGKFVVEAAEFIEVVKQHVQENTAAQWVEEEGDPAGIVASSEDEMLEIAAFVEHHRQAHPLVGVLRNSIYMRFSHCAYHKGSSLRELARRTGCAVEQVFAIGDGHNDLDKLNPAIAGMIACVGNSHAEVKQHIVQHGGYVAQAHGSLGAMEALQYFLRK